MYDRNRVSANAVVPIDQVLSAGGEQFVSDPKNPIVGGAKSSMRTVAPMVLVGLGNLLPSYQTLWFLLRFWSCFSRDARCKRDAYRKRVRCIG